MPEKLLFQRSFVINIKFQYVVKGELVLASYELSNFSELCIEFCHCSQKIPENTFMMFYQSAMITFSKC